MFNVQKDLCPRQENKKLLFPEMRVTKKIFTWAAASSVFLVNVIDFFKQSLHLKNYSHITFRCWKTKSPIFYCLKAKKCKFVRINLLVEIFLFVYVFLKQKIFSYTLEICVRKCDKKNHPVDFRKQDYFFLNQQNVIANFEPFKCIELLCVPWQVVYKYCDKSFINKPTFFQHCASAN